MKKILSILLAATMLLVCIAPVVATDSESALDVTLLSTQLEISSLTGQTVADAYFNEETQEMEYGPEWICYNWSQYTKVDAVIYGKTYENIYLSTIADICCERTGIKLYSGIMEQQSYENQWEVGGSYPVTYYIGEEGEEGRILWSVDLTVTVCEPTNKIQISDIEVDELSGWQDGDIHYYRWEEHGKMSITVGDQFYENISWMEFTEQMWEVYGDIDWMLDWATEYDEEEYRKLLDAYENPWTVGDELHAQLTIFLGEERELVYRDVICVRLIPSQIESFSIAPITFYVHDFSGDPVITAHYKDGTSAVVTGISYQEQDPWPTEPGTYTMRFLVANTFVVSAQVTALPTPTSGQLGDTVSWVYDEDTETMTLSGTGTAVSPGERKWTRLFMKLAPKKIVVSEGVEYLQDGLFYYGILIEEISLPSTLKEIPTCLIGFNGPTAGTYLEADYGVQTGVTSVTIPAGITSLTNAAFYTCWGITDIYLPAALEELDPDVLCAIVKTRTEMGLSAETLTIHFAGARSQWNQVRHVAGADRVDYGTGMTDEELEKMFATFSVICAIEDVASNRPVDLDGDGKITAFDAQVLAEAKAGMRTLTENQWDTIGDLTTQDYINYILGK